MKKGNKIAMIVVLLLVVVFGVGQFFAFSNITPSSAPSPQTAANQNPTATQVLQYIPPVLASGPQTKSGSCWTNSIAAPYRADAWRCTVNDASGGNGISDPCFQIPNSTNLICGVNPKTPGSEFLLKLTKPLPAPETLPANPPKTWGWLVEIDDGSSAAGGAAANGTLCSPFTGTLPFASDGETANYGCAPGPLGKDIMIFGDLNASSSVWTAKIGTLAAATSTKNPPSLAGARIVNVKTVWQ